MNCRDESGGRRGGRTRPDPPTCPPHGGLGWRCLAEAACQSDGKEKSKKSRNVLTWAFFRTPLACAPGGSAPPFAKNSLRREKVTWAGPNVILHHRGAVIARALLRGTFRSRLWFLEPPLPAANPSCAMRLAFLQRHLKQTGPPKRRLLRPIVEWRSGCLLEFSGSGCSWELFQEV
jgi:hypothetical protein